MDGRFVRACVSRSIASDSYEPRGYDVPVVDQVPINLKYIDMLMLQFELEVQAY